MASRMDIAKYLAGALEQGRRDAVVQAAAWLTVHGKQRQARYLARDVALIQAQRGYVSAHVTTARPLSATALANLERKLTQLTGAQHIELATSVDAALVGGAIIETPDASMDLSVRAKLAKFAAGVR